MSNYCKDIFEFIEQEKAKYKLPIQINPSWSWNMGEHLLLSELYTNGQLKNGKDDWTPVKNITLPILNLQHRAEDIELKDVQLYIDSKEKFHLSMLVKKYHDDVFVKENDLDTYFDELNVSRIDLGGGLSKKLFKARPEVVPLQSIAFCSQKDILSAPLGIEHDYSPDKLLAMSDKGWGNTANGATHTVEELVSMWREQEKQEESLKIYEVHGTMPARYADSSAGEYEYETRIFIVSFVQPKNSMEKKGVILYTAEENIDDVFKLVKRDPIWGRALGRGGAEELFEPQVWTTYDMIRKQKMLDAAAVTILQSEDPTVRSKNPKGLKNVKNLEIIDIAPNTSVRQIDTYPRNMQLLDKSVSDWEVHAQSLGGAQDPLMGKEPSAGTPFASVQAQIQQGMGLHDYRRGQFAKHIEEVYNDWIIPHIQKEITKGFDFLSELSLEEMNYVSESMSVHAWNEYATNKILDGGAFVDGEQETFLAQFKEDFKKGGNKRFLQSLKKEFANTKLGVKVSVAGKSKNLGQMTDKIVNLMRFAFSNPQGFAQIMQIPGMSKGWNEIIEFSGMTPMDFQGIDKIGAQQPQPAQPMQPEAQPVMQ